MAEEFRREVRNDFQTLLLSRRNEIRHPQPELAVELVYHLVVGAMRELVPTNRQLELDGSTFSTHLIREELAGALLAYLGAPGVFPASEHVSAGDPFDIWG
jgi:hypothetical protein